MTREISSPWTPTGSTAIATWARARGLLYEAVPAEAYFRAWEPHDTMISPERWFNACTQHVEGGHVVVAEPWTAGDGMEPVDRTVVAFVKMRSGGPVRRASMRVGEPFLTKVAFLEAPPPPETKLGDPVWDEHVATFAPSPSDALAAFSPALRERLRYRGFRGHLELRPGGFVVHPDGARPTPDGYEQTFATAHEIARKLVGQST
jgi:hypothetical protein